MYPIIVSDTLNIYNFIFQLFLNKFGIDKQINKQINKVCCYILVSLPQCPRGISGYMTWELSIKPLPLARHCPSDFIYIVSFNPHNGVITIIFLIFHMMKFRSLSWKVMKLAINLM